MKAELNLGTASSHPLRVTDHRTLAQPQKPKHTWRKSSEHHSWLKRREIRDQRERNCLIILPKLATARINQLVHTGSLFMGEIQNSLSSLPRLFSLMFPRATQRQFSFWLLFLSPLEPPAANTNRLASMTHFTTPLTSAHSRVPSALKSVVCVCPKSIIVEDKN